MKFSIGCDHAGPAYKEAITKHLENKGFKVVNNVENENLTLTGGLY